MHDRKLHVVRVALTLVVSLVAGLESGNQRDLRPSTLPGPRVDPVRLSFSNCDECGVAGDLIRGPVEAIELWAETDEARQRKLPTVRNLVARLIAVRKQLHVLNLLERWSFSRQP